MKKSQKIYRGTHRAHLIEIVCEKKKSGLWWASVTIQPNKAGVRGLALQGPYKPTSNRTGFDKPAEARAAALKWAKERIDKYGG